MQEPFELILVDDGSKDRSYQIMEELRQKDPRVKIIQMARNFGQHPALLCGFSHAEGDFIITMDDDLQHPPEEIPKLINTIRERDDVDVIIASYEGRAPNRSAVSEPKFLSEATSKMLERPKSADHQFSSDPPLPRGSHVADKHLSSADRQSSGVKFQPYHQCTGAS